MKKFGFTVAVALAAAVGLVVAVGASAAPPPPHPPGPPPPPPPKVVGHVYVNDNTAGVNTVAGFDRHPDGSLTPIPGSPFSTGGAGPGHGIASQGSLQITEDRHFLLAVDAGSNQISVLKIAHDGSLQVADVVSSNGGTPVSIAVAHNLVYVANADTDNPNYTGFMLDPHGNLRAIAGSTVWLPAGSQPGDVLFNKDGKKFVGTRVGTSEIDSFTVGHGGLLTAAPGSPFVHQAGAYGQFGSEFSPAKPDQLFVSNAHTVVNGPAPGSVSAYTDAGNGTLNPIGASPYANPGLASCWIEISHDGHFLFTVDTGSSTVATYSIAGNGALTSIGNTAIKNGHGAEDARLSPDGSTLWVVNTGGDTINAFAVKKGVLTELNSSPTTGPAGAAPTGIVVT
jgi:6-phosphogluconolactonase (cycloisomerase 2 family)